MITENMIITDENDNIGYMGNEIYDFINIKNPIPYGFSSNMISKGDVVLLFENNYNLSNEYNLSDLNKIGVNCDNEVNKFLVVGVYGDNRFQSIFKTDVDLGIDTVFNGNEIKLKWDEKTLMLIVRINEQQIITKLNNFNNQMIIYNEGGIKYFRDESARSRKLQVRDILNKERYFEYYINFDFFNNSYKLSDLLCYEISNVLLSLLDNQQSTVSYDNTKIFVVKNEVKIFNRFFNRYLIINSKQILNCVNKYIEICVLLSDSYEQASFKKANTFKFLGNDEKINRVKFLLEKASNTNTTILLTGESGTGKTFLAKEIHDSSRRNNNAFIHVNCAAIPYNLIESELFGYETGAFTSAKKGGKVGYFELANNGTIFLDEISEIPLDLQGKLLEVMQNQTFYRVGGTKKININVRIITATNRNLKNLVENNKFREDLYYRINVFPVELPPIRERIRDLYFIVTNILPDICKRIGCEPLIVSPEALKKMSCYKWPGNIRELENVLEKAAILGDGKIIMPDDIVLPVNESEDFSLKSQMEEYEKNIITKSLKLFNGEKIKTANYLNIGRTNLFEKIRKYNINIGDCDGYK